jgi:hypothetical protein
MPKYEIDEDILEAMLEAAYKRGAGWTWENPDSEQFICKAARDYADKTITEAFK